MSLMQKCCVLVLSVISSCILIECRSYNNGLVFYNLKTKQAYLPPTVSVSRGRGLASIKFSDKGSIWSTFGKPCDCAGPLCGCCVGIKVKQYNFDQKMCANVSYVRRKEEINLEVFLNETHSAKYAVSARNPSPFCIPVMLGIPMSMCIQMSNVGLQGDNMNACMDFMVQLASTQLFEMHFQCMQMGLQGLQWVVPGGAPVIPPSQSKITDRSDNVSDEYYDEEENVVGTGDPVNEFQKVGEDENKAEEEVDYKDLTEETTEANDKAEEEEETKENEVVLSEEKELQTAQDILKETAIVTVTQTDGQDEKTPNEESSELESFDMLTNTGEIPSDTNDNESNFNRTTEAITQSTETTVANDKAEEVEETKENEVVLSEEKELQTAQDILKGTAIVTVTQTDGQDEKTPNEESSELESFDMLTNTGEIPSDANDNESNFNRTTEAITQSVEEATEKQNENENVITANTEPTIATTTTTTTATELENSAIDSADNALTIATTMLTTTTTTTRTTSTTTTPTLVAPKTTEATPTAAATATTIAANNDSDNSQDNDSDYEDEEESDEEDDGADEEEGDDEEEEYGEENKVSDSEKEENQNTTSANDNTGNASGVSNDSNSSDHHEEEVADSEEYEEDYEETETKATTDSNESQLDSGFITSTTATTPAATADKTLSSASNEDIVEKTEHTTDDYVSNPPQSSTDAMLNATDTSSNSSSSGGSDSDSYIVATVDSATAGNIVNMSPITDTATATATPLTRARKLLRLHQQSHPERHQQQGQYLLHQYQQQLHQHLHNPRHQRYIHRHRHDA